MRIFSVSEVNRYLRNALESDALLADIWVSGEVSNFVRSAAGHCYFTLKNRESQLKCVFFRSGRSVAGVENGMAVIAHGRISLYEATGSLQFYVNLLQPEGVGLLNLQFEQLKAKLEEEGLFDVARKRPLPRFPRRIGVVTSPTGAVIHDIATIIGRRFPLTEIVLAPVLVQGDGAAESVAAGLRDLNARQDVDVIIVARGGGSQEELWCFNEEKVARGIYASRVPVVSAIGHETDYTIADYVADCRAPTPSAAAELVVPDGTEVRSQLELFRRSLCGAMEARLAARQDSLIDMRERLRRASPPIEPWRQRVDDLARTTERELETLLQRRREQFRARLLQLNSLSPLLTIARGYAVVQLAATQETVRCIEQVHAADRLRIRVANGTFDAEVVE